MIDSSAETLQSISEAAKAIPGRPHASTVWRWRTRGIAGVRLEVVCVGGRTYTSSEAVARFLRSVTTAKQLSTPRRLPDERESVQRAKSDLAQAGLI
jgi:hypothetical protein